jgi:hypothetical protein
LIRVFIGFDAREAVAFSVLSHSIHSRASEPVAIAPLMLSQLERILVRDRHPLQSTDFAFSRFLVPSLSHYEGWSLFMDCDMLMVDDIAKLWALRDERYAVQVVQHDHRPREQTKFLGQKQTPYPKKNWSSVMLFNNPRCGALTPEYVNSATGLDLHQFKWLPDDGMVGALPGRWNHLVGYDEPTSEVSLIHYTLGGPYFADYRSCSFADDWWNEREKMLRQKA